MIQIIKLYIQILWYSIKLWALDLLLKLIGGVRNEIHKL